MRPLSIKPFSNLPKLLILIILLCSTIVIHATNITIEGIVFQLVGQSAYLIDGKNTTSANVVIPYALSYNGQEYVVKNIQSNAFQSCDKIYSVVIPDGVVSVGESVFDHCNNLTTVTIGNGLVEIGFKMFNSCEKLSVITLGESITSIGDYSFYGCSEIEKIIFPEGMTKIGSYAFYNCAKLPEIVLPKNIQSIGDSAFWGCASLSTFNWPANITELPSGVLGKCSNLESVYLPEGIEKLGNSAFHSCSKLSNINLPKTLKVIDTSAFNGCSRLDNIKLPVSLQSIGNYAFASSGISSIVIPGSVTEVGTWCFCLSSKIKKVIFQDGVERIGGAAFYGAENLEEVVLGRTVTGFTHYNTAYGIFSYCRNLKTIVCKSNTVPNEFYSDCDKSFNWYPRSVSFLVPLGTKENYDSMRDFFTITEVAMEDLDQEYPTDCEPETEILVTAIALNTSSVEGKESDQIQITATVLPKDATNKVLKWSSSDESVATVDDTGLISLVKKGMAVITTSATDDSGVSAKCAVVVTESSGIEDILTDKSVYVKIFNLKGILIYEGIYSEANLVPDYYIVVCDGKNIKVKVK